MKLLKKKHYYFTLMDTILTMKNVCRRHIGRCMGVVTCCNGGIGLSGYVGRGVGVEMGV